MKTNFEREREVEGRWLAEVPVRPASSAFGAKEETAMGDEHAGSRPMALRIDFAAE